MNIGEIIGDAVRYPFSDWKKLLILGIIIVFTSISSIFQSFVLINDGLSIILFVVGFVFIGFFARGYQYRIIKSSLNNIDVLPEFDNWISMFVDGIKVSIVGVIYWIPGIVILAIVAFLFLTQAGSMSPTPSASDISLMISIVVLIFIAILYVIIITPVMLMAIAHMANNDSKLGSAFNFRDILNKISTNGWINLIIWYIVTGIIFLVLFIIGIFVTDIIGGLVLNVLRTVLLSLLVLPYLYMYIYRSVALFYMSK